MIFGWGLLSYEVDAIITKVDLKNHPIWRRWVHFSIYTLLGIFTISIFRYFFPNIDGFR